MADNLILSIDVGLVKLGYCVIQTDQKIVDLQNVSIKPAEKTKMLNYQVQVIQNIHQLFWDLLTKYNPKYVLIELQIGKYSAKQIEMLIMSAILSAKSDQLMFLVHPKCKLTMKYDPEFKVKADTKKYNQNKNESVAHAQAFLKQTEQLSFELDRDKADSLLQALYFIKKGCVLP